MDQRRCASGVESGKTDPFSPTVYGNEFSESMENDLGTPGAVHALQGLAHAILEAAKGQVALLAQQSAAGIRGRPSPLEARI